MPHLRNAQPSTSRLGYTHAPGTPVALLELLDVDNLVWLVEVALPRPDLVGDAEYECLELPAAALVFDREDGAGPTVFLEVPLDAAEDGPVSELPRKAA